MFILISYIKRNSYFEGVVFKAVKYLYSGIVGMVAYFCHHLSDNYVDLSDIYVDLSDLYVDLSDLYVDLSLIPSVEK